MIHILLAMFVLENEKYLAVENEIVITKVVFYVLHIGLK